MAKNIRKPNNSTKERKVNENIKNGPAADEADATDTTTAVTTEATAAPVDQTTTDAAGQEEAAPLADAGATTDESTTAPTADSTQADAPAAAGEGEGEAAPAEQLAPPPAEITLEQTGDDTDTAATVATTTAPVEPVAPPVVEAPAPADEAPSLLRHLQSVNPNITEIPVNIKGYAELLDGYIKAMSPNTPVNARDGVTQQKMLKYVLEQAIAAPNFQLAIEAVLFYFHQHGGRAFSDRYLGRFIHEMQLTTQQLNTFNTLRVVFQTLAEPTGRAARIKLALDVAKIAKTIDQKLVRNLLAFMDSVK